MIDSGPRLLDDYPNGEGWWRYTDQSLWYESDTLVHTNEDGFMCQAIKMWGVTDWQYAIKLLVSHSQIIIWDVPVEYNAINSTMLTRQLDDMVKILWNGKKVHSPFIPQVAAEYYRETVFILPVPNLESAKKWIPQTKELYGQTETQQMLKNHISNNEYWDIIFNNVRNGSLTPTFIMNQILDEYIKLGWANPARILWNYLVLFTRGYSEHDGWKRMVAAYPEVLIARAGDLSTNDLLWVQSLLDNGQLELTIDQKAVLTMRALQIA